MKTIEQLQARRAKLVDECDQVLKSREYDKTEMALVKKNKKEVALIDLCLRYLETSPNEAFLFNQLAESKRLISVAKQRYRTWTAPNGMVFKNDAARKAYYEKIIGVPKQKGYVATLTYLLN